MLKIRIIPVLTFNGFGLVKTKVFANPRMVGNPVQSARIYNSRGVDELVFLDIYASRQRRKINLQLVKDVIKECFMPVSIGGGIQTIDDINDLLRIGADKVVIKSKAIIEPNFILRCVEVFGSQCISIAVDAVRNQGDYRIQNELGLDIELNDFVERMNRIGVGEFILNSVDNDGLMNGFDITLVRKVHAITDIPIVVVGGGGNPSHFCELFTSTDAEAAGASSIFHFTQYTPLDVKSELHKVGKPVRI